MVWDRLVAMGVPIAAGVMTAAVLLGPAEERPAIGARVHGMLTPRSRDCAFRLETLEHLAGARQPTAVTELRVAVHDATGEPLCEWLGETGRDGVAETKGRLRRPVRAGEALDLSVSRKRDALARAGVALSAAGETKGPPSWSVEGSPGVMVTLPRGHLVPELPEPVLIETTGTDDRPTIELTVAGGDHEDVTLRKTACRGDACRFAATVPIVARAPTVRLTVDIALGGATSHWEGDLPIVPGGVWLDRPALASGMLTLRSATPRELVFVSKYDVTGRVWGASIPMTTDDDGFSEGTLPLPGGVDDGIVTYRLSSEPSEPPDATIGWPGLRMERASGVSMGVLADGLPAAIAAEQARMAKTRLPAFGLILAAGLFEVLYLLRRYRRQGEALDEHLEGHLKASPAGIRAQTPIAWVTFLSALLVLAFFILAAVAFWA
ncbi:MAG: hypothetical protein RIF41_09800 [Polyangiaceae bacterium]